jgi:methyl-accepting chemotaxis protein
MSTYHVLQFKNHPSISSEHIKFIATNMGLESIQKLETRVTQMEPTSRASAIAIQEVLNLAKTAANKVPEWVGKMEKIDKQVKKIEDRAT